MYCFSGFLTKTYVVGAQKNRLFKTVLLRTQNIYLNEWVIKKSHIYYQNFAYLNICVYKFIFNYYQVKRIELILQSVLINQKSL